MGSLHENDKQLDEKKSESNRDYDALFNYQSFMTDELRPFMSHHITKRLLCERIFQFLKIINK